MSGSIAAPGISLAESLPMELVLDILDAALINGRVDDLRWCLSLSLVCRTFRAAVLPVVYEIISFDIRPRDQGSCMGWDGHQHTDVGLAFLSWLLHDATAPPRQHVKHVIFRHEGRFSHKDLGWVCLGVDSEPSEWPFECLTTRYYQHAKHLFRAGMRPQKMFNMLPSMSRGGTISPLTGIFVRAVKDADAYRTIKTHQLTWVDEPLPDEASTDARARHAHQTRMMCCEVDPGAAVFIYNAPDQQTRPIHTVQLTAGDYLHQYPNLLLDGLAAAFEHSSGAQVVLACSVDYRIAGQSIGDFLRTAVPTALPREALEGRLRISHTAWTPIVVQDDPFYNLAHAIRCGRDPWDVGRQV